jgi:hypothetical protein
MNALTRHFLKLAVFFGLLFSSVSAGIDVLFDDPLSVNEFLLKGLFLGITVSALSLWIQIKKLKGLGVSELTFETLSPHQKRVIHCSVAPPDFIDRLKSDARFVLKNVEEKENEVIARTVSTWNSSGERIVIKMKELSEGEFEYRISSSPNWKFSPTDYGNGLENVNRLESLLVDHGLSAAQTAV